VSSHCVATVMQGIGLGFGYALGLGFAVRGRRKIVAEMHHVYPSLWTVNNRVSYCRFESS